MGKSTRKCEVCGLRRRSNDILFASFPTDFDRCRKWVKATGNEDLLFLPLSHLHKSKFICANHFSRKSFSRKKSRLRRNAVPTVDIKELPDELLLNLGANNTIIQATERTLERAECFSPSTTKHFEATDAYRKCAKCGATPIQDGLLAFHRFPRAGKTNDEQRVRAWAKFCWPEQDWSSADALAKLSSVGKVLCKRHFRDIYFTDSTQKRLGKFAIPTEGNNATNLKITMGNETTVVPQVHGLSNYCTGRELLAKFREEEAIAESIRKNQPVVTDENKNQTAVSDQNENQTAVSDHCENQPVVNINEDAVDDAQYLAGADDTGFDDDCHNISDDDCRVVVDDDSSFYHNESKPSDDKDDLDMEPHDIDKNEDLHDGFQCNYCSGEIKGYRYTCVQCPDYDLCGSCEARGAHCLHYVLRIPRPKPLTEIQPLLREIRRLLSGADTDVLWTQADEIKKEELIDDFDPLDIDDPVMPTSSETEDVPEMYTITSETKSHLNKQDDNGTVPEMIIQPLLASTLHNATTHTRHKETVTVDRRSAASTSSPHPRFVKMASKGTLLTIESSLQTIDKTRTPASESSQYNASTRLAHDENTVLTIESKPQVIDKTRTRVSASSSNPVLARIAPIRNSITFESGLQAIDKTRIPASESSQYTASTRLAPDGNTVLTIESTPQVIDKTRTRVSASSSNPVLARIAPIRNSITFESGLQAIDKTRIPASESSQYTASTRLAPDGNTVLTIESTPQVIDKTRTRVSASSSYPVFARILPKRNTLSNIESSPQVIDNSRTPAAESSIFTASTSVSSDGNTVLTIPTNVEDTDSTSRSVPSTSRLYASSSITPGDTETIFNKIKIIADTRLQVPSKRKCSENVESSKPNRKKVPIILKGSKKMIVVPSMSKVIGPGTRFKIINKPSATGQPQAQGTVYAARHPTQTTQQDQDAPK